MLIPKRYHVVLNARPVIPTWCIVGIAPWYDERRSIDGSAALRAIKHYQVTRAFISVCLSEWQAAKSATFVEALMQQVRELKRSMFEMDGQLSIPVICECDDHEFHFQID